MSDFLSVSYLLRHYADDREVVQLLMRRNVVLAFLSDRIVSIS